MKIVIPGGSGHLGGLLRGFLEAAGHHVVVVGRRADADARWDGRTQGDWTRELDGADAVINLAGRSVDCRYGAHNLSEMLFSRIDSARAVGEAIASARRPPRVWIQASTATIYAHTFGAPHDERSGTLGGSEPDAPLYWRFSVEIATCWERALAEAPTPATRRVALRTAIVMWPGRGGPFARLLGITRAGLGGRLAGGRQYVSWIHGLDFARAVLWLLERDGFEGAVNLASPSPLPQAELSRVLRRAAGIPFGLPATRWMLEAGAVLLRTDTELVLKSRRVVPGRLLDAGFAFRHPEWRGAAEDLIRRAQQGAQAPLPAPGGGEW